MPASTLSHLSEDDIRAKVVYQWLKGCGLTDADIVIEYSIQLQIGRGVKTINSRADVLVKNTSEQNLLIIEVKKSDHVLSVNDKQQALSYARALAHGGIAPFTLLTNGSDVLIFDSVNGEAIAGNFVPPEHNYIVNGFRVTGDSLKARAEALEYLISLSAENLLTFCKAQVQHKMQLLKSNDLFSGKKYIPQLYVERKHAKKELHDRLFKKKSPSQVILAIGPPQHGKTCFLCHTVEEYLDNNVPCLFYPAIALRNGLLQEIQDDFAWTFNEQFSPVHLSSRLRSIMEQTGQKLVLFVDGWNEMVNQALRINDECQRLQQNNIQLVLSTTSPSLTRLLQDEADNLTYIASETKLSAATIRKLTTEPLQHTKELGIVQIGTFDYDEKQKGKTVYEQAYNVRFLEGSNLPQDPFYLRLAAESYTNKTVPAFATRTELIRSSLIRKGARRGIKEIELFSQLNQLAAIIIEKDAPFCCIDLPANLQADNVLSRWIESAILIYLREKQIPEVDFYYTHDKDYCIAILNRKWHETLIDANKEMIASELQKVINTEAGKSALRWFLSCPEHCYILEEIFAAIVLNSGLNKIITKILTDSILNQININENLTFNWLEKQITPIISSQQDPDEFTTEIAILIYSLVLSLDSNREKDKYELWMRLLLKYDNSIKHVGIDESYIYKIFEKLSDVELFEKMIYDSDIDIAKKSSMIIAYSHPDMFMLYFVDYKSRLQSLNRDYKNVLLCAVCEMYNTMHENYYGTMCRGWLLDIEEGNEDVVEEYKKMKEYLPSIISSFLGEEVSESLLGILTHLRELSGYNEELDINYHTPNQLKINFDYGSDT